MARCACIGCRECQQPLTALGKRQGCRQFVRWDRRCGPCLAGDAGKKEERDDPLFAGCLPPAELRAAALERAAEPEFGRRVQQAAAVIRRAMQENRKPYLAYSGGKDSVTLGHLAGEVPNLPYLYGDDELLYDDHIAFVAAQPVMPLLSQAPQLWHKPWPDLTARQWRPRPPFAPIVPSVRTYAYVQGYDACLVGLRRSEAQYRAQLLAGRFDYVSRYGLRNYAPLRDWSHLDVWAYIHSRDLPYCPVYDRLAELGVPLERQRLGPLVLSEERLIRAGWPDLWGRLEQAGLAHHWHDTRLAAPKILRR